MQDTSGIADQHNLCRGKLGMGNCPMIPCPLPFDPVGFLPGTNPKAALAEHKSSIMTPTPYCIAACNSKSSPVATTG